MRHKYEDRLDAYQLAALAAVIEAGSFEAAAEHLFVTPSAVSQRIKALEHQVGQSWLCAKSQVGQHRQERRRTRRRCPRRCRRRSCTNAARAQRYRGLFERAHLAGVLAIGSRAEA